MRQAAIVPDIDAARLVANLPSNAIEFFALFARCEYAMKRCGYARDEAGYIAADWRKLSRRLGPEFYSSVIQKTPILGKQPPRIQIFENNRLAWRDGEQPADTYGLLKAVRSIRNNLFHGGKFTGGPEFDVSRNEVLLREGLLVLQEIFRSEPRLRAVASELS